MRSILLAGSESRWLRQRATRYRFVRGAVSRFMPGESLEDALQAAAALAPQKISTILTHLGENVSTPAEAEAVGDHYVDALHAVQQAGLDAEISVKLTQVGLDQGEDLARAQLEKILVAAAGTGNRIWIDMESTAYTERTLSLYQELRRTHSHVGVCVQSYLRRTPADLDALIPMGAAIRLVKGAYNEPAALAFTSKGEVDESFFLLARRLLSAAARQAGVWTGFGTHDSALIGRIIEDARATGCPADAYEVEMLYGIRRDEQLRLSSAGTRTRVLVSYGSSWFPWFMRRLAERPANLLFVARNLF